MMRLRRTGRRQEAFLKQCVGAAIGVLSASLAQGQCEGWFNDFGGRDSLNKEIRCVIEWDSDGPGPEQPRIVAGGDFTWGAETGLSHVAMWEDGSWRPIGQGTDDIVEALTTWDPDGDGPAARVLVAGGDFTTAGGAPAVGVAIWDGDSWSALGAGLGPWPVRALGVWDPDGAGPASEQLFAGGDFTSTGSAAVKYLARWDGTGWSTVGSGVSAGVSGLTTWDPDGVGPALSQLIASGSFTSAGGISTRGIASWNGVQWSALGTGLSGIVDVVAAWDADDDGPLPPRLVVGGSLLRSGSVSLTSLALWDGSSWSPVGGGVNGPVFSLAAWPGAGASASRLFVGGQMTAVGGQPAHGTACWDGLSWTVLGVGVGTGPTPGTVDDLAVWDEDGAGPLPAMPVAVGNFYTSGEDPARGVVKWDGERWVQVGAGFALVRCVQPLDPDGPGGLATGQLCVAGSMGTAGGIDYNGTALWDGAAWQPLGPGLDGGVTELTSWDADGDGPQPAQLIAGGAFTTSGGTVVNNIARWDGAAWRAIGSGMNSYVRTLESWDPDGNGPQSPWLIAAGVFTTAGGTAAKAIARWDGATWQPMGAGLDSEVLALCNWDPDGDGPQIPQLIAGGSFSGTGIPSKIARWTGTTWQPVGPSLGLGSVQTLTSWDPDGAGPMLPRLVAGGLLYPSPWGPPFDLVLAWDGVAWSRVGDSLERPGDLATAYAAVSWDPDGPGPATPQLVVGGNFTRAGSIPAVGVTAWDAAQWRPMGPGLHSTFGAAYVSSMAMANSYSSTGGPALVAAGRFLTAGGLQAGYAATWRLSCCADLNGDGVVDFGDYLEFLNLYEAGDARVDFSADGVIDFGDYLEFLNLYEAGC